MRVIVSLTTAAGLILASSAAMAGGKAHNTAGASDGTKQGNCKAEASTAASGARSNGGAIRRQAYQACMAR